jgi:hypothetical protein
MRRWLPSSEAFRYQWQSLFYLAPLYILFILSDDSVTFTLHPAKPIRRRPKHPVRAFTLEPSSTTRSLPAAAVPVDVEQEHNQYVIPSVVSSIMDPPPVPLTPNTWQDYLSSLPQWEQELIADSTIVERRLLFQALRPDHLIYLASDGGAADRRGSFGALIASCDTILAECGGRALGADPRSFRAEGYGLLAILRLAFHLRNFYHTYNSNLKFRLHCGSESLLLRLEASRKLSRTLPRRYLYSEVDVEMQIRMAIQALGGIVYLEHVEGHQDTKYPDKPLPWAAKLNMHCDEIATLHLENAAAPIPTVTFLLHWRTDHHSPYPHTTPDVRWTPRSP